MDFSYLREVLPQYVAATWQTLQLSLWGVALSLVFGLLVCIAVVYRLPFFAPVCRAYIELSRNTPLLVQLFFLYYGLPKFGIRLSGFACGVIGLTFLGAAYMAEAFRGGIAAVSRVQGEAALAVGLTPAQAFLYVIFPQSLAASIPALVANTLFLIKETSVVGWIGLNDIMRGADNIRFQTATAFQSLFAAAAMYLILTAIFTRVMARVERKLKHDDNQR